MTPEARADVRARTDKMMQELTTTSTPRWLKKIGANSKRRGTDTLSLREINAEIAAARRR